MVSSEIRAEARKSLTGKWGKAALLTLAYSVISYLLSWVLNNIPVIGPIANIVITVPIAFGFLVGFIKLKRGEEVGYFDFFQNGFSSFGKLWAVLGYTILKMILPIIAIVISIIMIAAGGAGSILSSTASSSSAVTGSFGILAIIGFILYFIAIIWTVIKGYSYTLTQYLLYDNQDMVAKDIVEKSEELMKGHKWAYFWLGLTFIGWAILSCFTLGIGLLWLIPYAQVAQIIFYEDLAGAPVKSKNAEEKEDNNPISE